MRTTYLISGEEVTKEKYLVEILIQHMLYGTVISRFSMMDDGNFVNEIIDYTKVWKQVGGLEPTLWETKPVDQS